MATTNLKNVNKAWEAFFESEKIESKEELNAQGWMTVGDVHAKFQDRSYSAIDYMLNGSTVHEKRLAKIQLGKRVKEMQLFRPKV